MADDAFFDGFVKEGGENADLEQAASLVGKVLTDLAGEVVSKKKDLGAAMTDYQKLLPEVLKECGVENKQIFALDDNHPLKEYFFAQMDLEMFSQSMSLFMGQAKDLVEGKELWDAEPAVGEGDEDHTLE